MKKLILVLACLMSAAYGQTPSPVYGNESSALVRVTALPATCGDGETRLLIGTGAKICHPANTWIDFGGSGPGGSGTVTNTGGALPLNQILAGAGGADIKASNLTGDVATSGTMATVLATVNANVGQFTKLTVNGKGLVTGATTLASGDIPALAESGITNLVSDLGLKAPLASPTFTGTVGGITATMVGLSAVTNDAQTKAAVVPNTAPSAGQIHVGNAGGTAFGVVSMGGDATMLSTGAVTVTKTNNVAFATSATTDATNAANIGSGTLPAARLPALTGDVTTSIGTVATSLATVQKRRTCVIENDTQSVTALIDAQITGRCDVDEAATLVEIAVYASSGTPTVLLERWRPNGGTVADLLSATIPTAASGGFACAMSTISQACIAGITSSGTITLSNTSLSAGDVIRVKTATAGGTATWHKIKATWTVN